MKFRNGHSLDSSSKNTDIRLDNLSVMREETRTAPTHKASTWERRVEKKKFMGSTLRRNTNCKNST